LVEGNAENSSEMVLADTEFLQQLAVLTKGIEKVLFWDVFKEFPISQRVLHQFT
jgi:hypothetical protein